MRYSKKSVALLLTVTFIFGVTSCKKAEITRESFISGIESYGLEKTDDVGALSSVLMRRGGKSGYYVATDKDDAEDLSNKVLDRLDTYADFKATDFILAAVAEKGSDGKEYQSYACYLTFGSDNDAKTAYNDIVDSSSDMKDAKKGTKSGVTYSVVSRVASSGSNKIGTGVYLNGNTVVKVRSISSAVDGYKFVDQICGKLGLISPSKAG